MDEFDKAIERVRKELREITYELLEAQHAWTIARNKYAKNKIGAVKYTRRKDGLIIPEGAVYSSILDEYVDGKTGEILKLDKE